MYPRKMVPASPIFHTVRSPAAIDNLPYNASAAPFALAKEFLDAGYAFVGANMTATGCSEGILDHWFTRKEGVHGAEVIEWIAKQFWSDGNVGMVGNSSAEVEPALGCSRTPSPFEGYRADRHHG
ncbi:CocE/NonD family hydrolase [Mesorhizobium sp.]|uniref:CocE/NonD family hydrolase n=1 Tax=Mesorhizobium sp. TaxID=1871066 RepID=UPI00257BC9A8|nr:CocE/NonD family hydrolase [Mesorhizobium sp.]